MPSTRGGGWSHDTRPRTPSISCARQSGPKSRRHLQQHHRRQRRAATQSCGPAPAPAPPCKDRLATMRGAVSSAISRRDRAMSASGTIATLHVCVRLVPAAVMLYRVTQRLLLDTCRSVLSVATSRPATVLARRRSQQNDDVHLCYIVSGTLKIKSRNQSLPSAMSPCQVPDSRFLTPN